MSIYGIIGFIGCFGTYFAVEGYLGRKKSKKQVRRVTPLSQTAGR